MRPSLFSDDNIRGFDNRHCGIADFELQLIHGFVCNGGRNHNTAANIDPHMSRRLPFLDANDFSLKLIAGAKFHRIISDAVLRCLAALPMTECWFQGIKTFSTG
jgi:hypothetical protein